MHKSIIRLLIACLLTISSWGQAPADNKQSTSPVPVGSNVHTTDDADVLRETQLGIDVKGYTGLVWWIPFEFWVHSAEKRGDSPEKAREGLKALKDYTVVGVFAAKVSTLGSFDYVSPADLQRKTFIRDSEGQEYAALSELTGDAKSLADIVRPMLANAMGRAGENFAMLFFPAKRKAGQFIADATSKGSFSVVFKDAVGEPETVFLWRTPLTSFSPRRYCPVGKEQVHADWDYCPWHGVKLEVKP